MHLPPPPTPPPSGAALRRAPPTAPQKSRATTAARGQTATRAWKEGAVCERHAHYSGVRVRAEKDGRRESGTAAPITITWRAATALPTAAARATTRPLHHAAAPFLWRSAGRPSLHLNRYSPRAPGCTLVATAAARGCTATSSPLPLGASAAPRQCDCEVCADSDTDKTRDVILQVFSQLELWKMTSQFAFRGSPPNQVRIRSLKLWKTLLTTSLNGTNKLIFLQCDLLSLFVFQRPCQHYIVDIIFTWLLLLLLLAKY